MTSSQAHRGAKRRSARVVPRALHRAGFAFAQPTIDGALDSVLRPAG
ncbi:DUF1731 domain-containing protein [Streptomyces sp. NPDC048191]